MPYAGKPSRGCQTCRKRRIKCDEKRPSCANCNKSKRDCGGYREESDLIFRNETETTQLRATRKKPSRDATPFRDVTGPSPLGTQWSSASSSTSAMTEHERKSPGSIPRNPPECHEQQALCYFFAEYIMLPRHPEASRGYLEMLLPLYVETDFKTPLFAATSAIALAALSSRPGWNRMMENATEIYGTAVSRLKQSIADPIEQRSDYTLLTVQLLGLYETLTCTPSSLPAWAQHVEGAVTLVRLRGDEILEKPISRKLFGAVRAQMVLSHITKCELIEDFPGTSNWDALVTDGIENAANRLTVLSMKIPALRAEAMRIMQAPMSEKIALALEDLMRNAHQVDQDVAAWPFGLPDSWKYQTVALSNEHDFNPRDSELYPGPVHSYYDLWVSNVWNSYRSTRIFCLSIIVNCVERLVPRSRYSHCPQYVNALRALQTMVDDICFSVPFHMGCQFEPFHYAESVNPTVNDRISKDDTDLPRARPDKHMQVQSAKALGGYFLVWHLFIAISTLCVSEPQRIWIGSRLGAIGEKHGINQAKVLSSLGIENLASQFPDYTSRKPSITDFAPPVHTHGSQQNPRRYH